MSVEVVKDNWDKLWKEGLIHYYPKENKEITLLSESFPLTLEYAPERAKRFQGGKNQELPLGTEIWKRKDCLYEFDNLVLLANNRPVTRYHSILCSREYHPQNELAYEEIYEVTSLVERHGFRAFLNLVGTAATLNHFHTQVLFDPFHLEKLPYELMDNNIGTIPDYPGGNLLITGKAKQRCKLLFDLIKELTNSETLITIKKNGMLSETPLFSLLFWEDKILFVPRRKEISGTIDSMVGGLELSGHFLITAPLTPDNPFEGVQYESLLSIIEEVTYSQNDINSFLQINSQFKGGLLC